MHDPRAVLLDIFSAGLTAINGEQVVYQTLVQRRQPRCHVVAIGKAADAMLQGALRYLREDLQSALLITKHAHVSDKIRQHPAAIKIIESSHPVPDSTSLQAGEALCHYLYELPQGARVLFLISGGTSSLVEVLKEGWSLEALQAKTQELLADGSSIAEINAVRRDLSLIKGGKLWQVLGQRQVDCLLISDVAGDDPAVIGSGLLFPVPEQVKDFSWQIIASNQQILQAMRQFARQQFALPITVLGDFQDAAAEQVAQSCVTYIQQHASGLYLWSAETSVILPENPGYGGRNQHLALAAAQHLQDVEGIYLLAAGTDGTDGMSEEAGALVDSSTVQRGESTGLDVRQSLQAADSGTFLAASGDLINTGPTGSNVMDVIIGLKV